MNALFVDSVLWQSAPRTSRRIMPRDTSDGRLSFDGGGDDCIMSSCDVTSSLSPWREGGRRGAGVAVGNR